MYGVTAGEVTAAVSRVSRPRLRPERRHLLAHQAVLRRLMEHTTVLPAAFGHVAWSDDAVRDWLRESGARFREQLAHVAGKVEMGLRVRWSTPDLVAYFVAAHPELAAARDRLRERPEPGREALIAVGKLFEALREADREAYAERVAAVLREHGIEPKPQPPREEREVMNLACLVPREAVGTFERVVEAAAAGFDEHFNFEFNGPWAPHRFTALPSTATRE